jgi:small subunit ribosomal protein S6
VLRRYETIFITHPELSEENHAELEKNLRSTITAMKGDAIKLEDWGSRKLGYEIGKNSRGRYFFLDYLAGSDLVREIERNLRLNDQVLKFQTVKVTDRVSPETAKALKLEAPGEKPGKGIERPSTLAEKVNAEDPHLESEEGEAK